MTNHCLRLHARRGMSVAEMAFALLVIGAVLSGLWLAVGHVYRNWDVMQTEKQIAVLTQVARQAHLTGFALDDQSLMQFGLPADMLGHVEGRTLIYNRWHGLISIKPGDTFGWAGDQNNFYTVSFDGIPSSACLPLVLEAGDMSKWGLASIAVSDGKQQTRLMCADANSYCKDYMFDFTEKDVKPYCDMAGHITLIYTFTTN